MSVLTEENKRIHYLDAWRFIAVFMVIFGHAVAHTNISKYADIIPGISRLAKFSHLGVLIFFVISGFVITKTLLNEYEKFKTVSITAFYIRRFLRIIPPIFLYLIVLSMLNYANIIQVSSLDLFKAAFFICNLSDCGWLVGHTWSVAYEEQFYLIYPFIFVLLMVRNPRYIVLFFVFSVLLSIWNREIGNQKIAFYFSNISFLLMGCVAAFYDVRKKLGSKRFLIWAISVIVLFSYVLLSPKRYIDDPGNIETIIFPMLIVLILLASPTKGAIANFIFNRPIICYLGKISYSVYLWQQLATEKFQDMSPLWSILFIPALFLWAHLLWKYFELPIITFAKRISNEISERSIKTKNANCIF